MDKKFEASSDAIVRSLRSTLAETETMHEAWKAANRTRESRGYRVWHEAASGYYGKDVLAAKSQDLFEWAALIQQSRPVESLLARCREARIDRPSFPIVRAELELRDFAPGAGGDFKGGLLMVELELELDPEQGLLRHDERLNGYLVTGGGVLNTPTALAQCIYPQALMELHRHVSEGTATAYAATGLRMLVRKLKDR